MKKRLFWLGVGALAIACLFGYAAENAAPALPTEDTSKIGVKVGEPAPALKPSGWVQGKPVKKLEQGQAYLIEFWATWCIPCRESIPHLDQLHRKYKDKGLTVIGTNVGEDPQRVKEFVEKLADKMTYRVALDEKETVAKTWYAGADENPIPFAFLIDSRGKIVWKGFPLELDEKTIEKALPGSAS